MLSRERGKTGTVDWPVFSGLPEDEVHSVLAAAHRRRFGSNEVVFHEGDPGDSLHLLVTGHVRVQVTTPLGDTAILSVLGPGAVFGELALVSESDRRSATIQCLEHVETLALHRQDLDALRRRHPSIDRVLLGIVGAQLRAASARLLETLFVPAEKRVLREVLALAHLYGSDDRPGTIPLTQEDLAGLAGTTRPTVNKVLRAAEDAGVLRLGRGHVDIVNVELLRRRAR